MKKQIALSSSAQFSQWTERFSSAFSVVNIHSEGESYFLKRLMLEAFSGTTLNRTENLKTPLALSPIYPRVVFENPLYTLFQTIIGREIGIDFNHIFPISSTEKWQKNFSGLSEQNELCQPKKLVYEHRNYQGLSYLLLTNQPEERLLVDLKYLHIYWGILPSTQYLKHWIAMRSWFEFTSLLNIQVPTGRQIEEMSPIQVTHFEANKSLVPVLDEPISSDTQGFSILFQIANHSLWSLRNLDQKDSLSKKIGSKLYKDTCQTIESYLKQFTKGYLEKNFDHFLESYQKLIDEVYTCLIVSPAVSEDLIQDACRSLIQYPFNTHFGKELSTKGFITQSGMDANAMILSALFKGYGDLFKCLYYPELYYEQSHMIARIGHTERAESLTPQHLEHVSGGISVVMTTKYPLSASSMARTPVDIVAGIQYLIDSNKVKFPLSIVVDMVHYFKGDHVLLNLVHSFFSLWEEGKIQFVFFDSGHKFYSPFGQQKLDFGLIITSASTLFPSKYQCCFDAYPFPQDGSLNAIALSLGLMQLNNDYQKTAVSNAKLLGSIINDAFQTEKSSEQKVVLIDTHLTNLPWIECVIQQSVPASIDLLLEDMSVFLKEKGTLILVQDGFSFERTTINSIGPDRIRLCAGIEPTEHIANLGSNIIQFFKTL